MGTDLPFADTSSEDVFAGDRPPRASQKHALVPVLDLTNVDPDLTDDEEDLLSDGDEEEEEDDLLSDESEDEPFSFA